MSVEDQNCVFVKIVENPLDPNDEHWVPILVLPMNSVHRIELTDDFPAPAVESPDTIP